MNYQKPEVKSIDYAVDAVKVSTRKPNIHPDNATGTEGPPSYEADE